MPKKIFRVVIGTIFCLTALFAISSLPANAFNFFGLLKPGKREAYQAQGSFDYGPLVAGLKDRALKSGPVQWHEVYTGTPAINTLTLRVTEDGNISGSGEVGHITAEWKSKFEGSDVGMWMDHTCEFTFSGTATGKDLKGKGETRILSYGWKKELIDDGGSSSPLPLTWWATKEDGKIDGEIKMEVDETTLSFSAVAGVTPSPSPSSQPSPSPGEKRRLQLFDLKGKLITKGKAIINLKDGTIKKVDVVNGEIVYESGLVSKITIRDLDNPDRQLALQEKDLEREKMIMATQEEWLNQMMPKLEELAQLLNDGQEIDLNELFEINPNSQKSEYKPPPFGWGWLRKFGFKDKIDFDAEQMAWTADVNTVIHEILGHAFTEVIGEGNKMTYAAAGSHDDPWQPAYKERSIINPARWLGGKIAPLTEDQAKGMALSEGWAQYAGDKWDRELKNIPDEESELTTANAQSKMADSKNRVYGNLYSDEGYGAKVENVVATVFNEIYKGKSLEEAVADFTAVREEFKRIHSGNSFQTINQFIYQKLDMVEDGLERERIRNLFKDLVLE